MIVNATFRLPTADTRRQIHGEWSGFVEWQHLSLDGQITRLRWNPAACTATLTHPGESVGTTVGIRKLHYNAPAPNVLSIVMAALRAA